MKRLPLHTAALCFLTTLSIITTARADSPAETALLNRGIKDMGHGRYHQAIRDFTEAIRLEPENPKGHYWRGQCYMMVDDFDKAIADLSKWESF